MEYPRSRITDLGLYNEYYDTVLSEAKPNIFESLHFCTCAYNHSGFFCSTRKGEKKAWP